MNQRDKLIARIRARPPEANFDDVRRLLELFGYTARKSSSGHFAFRKPGSRTITIPTVKGRKVKRLYLDRICELLGLDEDP